MRSFTSAEQPNHITAGDIVVNMELKDKNGQSLKHGHSIVPLLSYSNI